MVTATWAGAGETTSAAWAGDASSRKRRAAAEGGRTSRPPGEARRGRDVRAPDERPWLTLPPGFQLGGEGGFAFGGDGDGPAAGVGVDGAAGEALGDRLVLLPEAALAQLHGDRGGAGVAQAVAHRIAVAPLADDLAGDQRRLHGDVERLADLHRQLRALRRMADGVLADELRRAGGVALVDADGPGRQAGGKAAGGGVGEGDRHLGAGGVVGALEGVLRPVVDLAGGDAVGVEEAHLLGLVLGDR